MLCSRLQYLISNFVAPSVAIAHSAVAMRPWSPIRRAICARRRSGNCTLRSNVSNIAVSSANRGLPSIACKCVASASRPFAASVVVEPDSCSVLLMVRPYHVPPGGMTGWIVPRRRQAVTLGTAGGRATGICMAVSGNPVQSGASYQADAASRGRGRSRMAAPMLSATRADDALIESRARCA